MLSRGTAKETTPNTRMHTQTQAQAHTCWGHWSIVRILPLLLWTWQGGEDPWFISVQRPVGNHSSQGNAEHLCADNSPACPWWCIPCIRFALITFKAQEIPRWEYRITIWIKQQWCYLAWSSSSAWHWVPGVRTPFPPLMSLRPVVPPEMSGS